MKRNSKISLILILACFGMLFSVSLKNAYAAEILPKVGFVGIMDNPARFGEEQTITFTSMNYVGDVQYKVFYIQRDEDVKMSADKWQVLTDWTSPQPAETPVEIKVPANLATKAARYDFAVRVKRAWTDGTKPNSYGGYDDAYLFRYVYSAFSNPYIKTITADKVVTNVGEGIKITGNPGVTYRLFTFKEGRRERWDKYPIATGSNFIWTPTEAGDFIIDVQAMNGNKVVGWKLIKVKVNETLRVESVN